jgi:hypothetical protein
MISDEVRMLLNRMRSNPEEFVDPNPRGFRADTIRASVGKWDTLMSSLVGNKPDLEFMFDPEEIEALRACAKELIQPKIRATIVKQIVGGEDKAQAELDLKEYQHPYNYGNIGRAFTVEDLKADTLKKFSDEYQRQIEEFKKIKTGI